ncbi:hypothetical protein JHK82_025495 [Glycine max]|nr:hypothetical protein JHK85_026116 [Glycine max]KAG5013358.1 hypothetical protein JHK86_025619 [Glycine max]KAG5134307.1 hypothetical protein JHK82_025495 [Glycine max]
MAVGSMSRLGVVEQLLSIGCLKHNTNQSYVFMAGDEAESDDHDWLRHCEEHVVVTVKQDEIEKLVA